jgi:O-methyltransferase
MYLEHLKRCLTGIIQEDPGIDTSGNIVPFDCVVRTEGRDWPKSAYTMVGLRRLDNLQFCIEDVIRNNIPGDLIETGTWRGGASIFMRAVLKAYGITNRTVWVADSFRGLPPPNPEKYPMDKGDIHHTIDYLRVSSEQVRSNFARFNLLDDQVRFLEGWFSETLPTAPISSLAILRIDADMYESTMEALIDLHPKLSNGGYVIIDDYGALPGCRKAVDDYRATNGITQQIIYVDWTGIYWQCP